ncbi:MAG: hypothetical protein ABW152_09315 [Candidatus Thiodiazotropha endolucinida]
MKPGTILKSGDNKEKGVIAVGCFGMQDMSFMDLSFINSSLGFTEALIEYVAKNVKELEAEFFPRGAI